MPIKYILIFICKKVSKIHMENLRKNMTHRTSGIVYLWSFIVSKLTISHILHIDPIS